MVEAAAGARINSGRHPKLGGGQCLSRDDDDLNLLPYYCCCCTPSFNSAAAGFCVRVLRAVCKLLLCTHEANRCARSTLLSLSLFIFPLSPPHPGGGVRMRRFQSGAFFAARKNGRFHQFFSSLSKIFISAGVASQYRNIFFLLACRSVVEFFSTLRFQYSIFEGLVV